KTASQKVRGGFKITHRKGEPTSSYYKGVTWNEREGVWQAQIVVRYRQRRIGSFDNEVAAAHAYDEAAREHFGADARVNFPLPGELPTALDPTHPRAPREGLPHPLPNPPSRPRKPAKADRPHAEIEATPTVRTSAAA
ncbi:MAG: hypothetical protein K2Q09_04260, partial [Phycisphaerales bacterium]|nr:hypothetical protein [Phycisphaerales bacterium]